MNRHDIHYSIFSKCPYKNIIVFMQKNIKNMKKTLYDKSFSSHCFRPKLQFFLTLYNCYLQNMTNMTNFNFSMHVKNCRGAGADPWGFGVQNPLRNQKKILAIFQSFKVIDKQRSYLSYNNDMLNCKGEGNTAPWTQNCWIIFFTCLILFVVKLTFRA